MAAGWSLFDRTCTEVASHSFNWIRHLLRGKYTTSLTSSDRKACLRWVYLRKRATGSTLEPVYIMMKKKVPDR